MQLHCVEWALAEGSPQLLDKLGYLIVVTVRHCVRYSQQLHNYRVARLYATRYILHNVQSLRSHTMGRLDGKVAIVTGTTSLSTISQATSNLLQAQAQVSAPA